MSALVCWCGCVVSSHRSLVAVCPPLLCVTVVSSLRTPRSVRLAALMCARALRRTRATSLGQRGVCACLCSLLSSVRVALRLRTVCAPRELSSSNCAGSAVDWGTVVEKTVVFLEQVGQRTVGLLGPAHLDGRELGKMCRPSEGQRCTSSAVLACAL